MMYCACGKPTSHVVGLLNEVCEECADAMIACEHEEGTRSLEYDDDGCGYFLWTCNECGYTEHDDLP
jgi:hypothetical protein